MKSLTPALLYFTSWNPVLAYIRAGPVLDLVQTVAVGEPTLVRVNLSAHDPCNEITHHKGCGWPYMQMNLAAAPLGHPGKEKYWEPYCFVSGCLTANITSFNFTLPPGSLPNGGPYKLSYSFFNLTGNPRDPIDHYMPSQSMYDPPLFNITGNNDSDPSAQWTQYDTDGHWWGGLGNLEGWLTNMSCASVGCGRQCAQRVLAPLLPESPSTNAEMTACLKACPGYGWDPYACTRENVLAPPTSTGGGDGNATRPTGTLPPSSVGSKVVWGPLLTLSSVQLLLTASLVL
ncbi:hypothetical protein PGQ11_011621 [Apiospora arundinis]|uniref:Osmotin, thaumatin-like protein n=1 Tax=Apiospora arundinis TaxID=335852 RepID=A0ABR2I043_9PEZI